MSHSRRFIVGPWAFIALASLVLVVLWFPGLKYPVVSDTAIYALLGRSVWTEGVYHLFGQPYAKHLPFHAVTAYPLTLLFGVSAGMKAATLLAGMAVLLFAYLLVARTFSRPVARIAVIGILFHPAFVLMTQFGSADLLFTALFLATLVFFLRARDDARWYVLAGVAAGCMCLTRYNGIPVLPFLGAWTLWDRRHQLRSPWLLAGAALALGIVSVWFIRNQLTFGDAFHTDYTGELSAEGPDHWAQLVSNTLYYLNPVHNIFPFFLPFSLYGLWRYGRPRVFLILAMLSVWVLTSVWWVQAMRFAFPGYVILLGFAGAGIVDLYNRFSFAGFWFFGSKRKTSNQKPITARLFFIGSCVILFLGIHAAGLCLYTYGECNAFFDRTVGGLPPDMGLTSEGFYAWYRAAEYVNAHAEPGSAVVAGDDVALGALREGFFRPDLQVRSGEDGTCPTYVIAQIRDEAERARAVFTTTDAPHTSVTRTGCPGS